MLHWGSVLNLIITFSIPLRFHIVALCDFISFCHRKNIIDKTYPSYWKSYAKVSTRDIKFQKQNRRIPYISRLLRFWYCLYTQVVAGLEIIQPQVGIVVVPSVAYGVDVANEAGRSLRHALDLKISLCMLNAQLISFIKKQLQKISTTKAPSKCKQHTHNYPKCK